MGGFKVNSPQVPNGGLRPTMAGSWNSRGTVERTLRSIRIVIFTSKLNLLMPFGPASIILHFTSRRHVSVSSHGKPILLCFCPVRLWMVWVDVVTVWHLFVQWQWISTSNNMYKRIKSNQSFALEQQQFSSSGYACYWCMLITRSLGYLHQLSSTCVIGHLVMLDYFWHASCTIKTAGIGFPFQHARNNTISRAFGICNWVSC